MKLLSFLRRIFNPRSIACYALLAALIIFAYFFVSVTCVFGPSMDPTLADGQLLVGLKVNNIPFLEVSRGDIITTYNRDDGVLIIKRVIALPGDRVALVGGQLYLNGEKQHEPYIYEPMNDVPTNNIPEFTVPEGQYFILGDNRNVSKDSRMIGCIKQEDIHSLIPLQYQALAGAGLIFYAVQISWLADSFGASVELWLKAHTAAKKTNTKTEQPAEPDESVEPEEPAEPETEE